MVNLTFRILVVALVVAGVFSLTSPVMAAKTSQFVATNPETGQTTMVTVPETAQDEPNASAKSYAEMFGVLGGLLGSGIIVFGAAIGIGKIASSTTEAIARQPEAGGRLFTTMVIAASLIEGIAFFGLIVCFVTIFMLT